MSGHIEPIVETEHHTYVNLTTPPPSPTKQNEDNPFKKDRDISSPNTSQSNFTSTSTTTKQSVPKEIPKSLFNCNSYIITRKKRISIKGTSYIFQLIKDDNIIFSAKCKNRLPTKPVPIIKGENVHLSTGGEFYLQPFNSAQTFYLFKESVGGTKILTASVIHTVNSAVMKRSMVVRILNDSGMPETSLLTRRPFISSNGEEQLLNQDDFTLPSVKNSHFYNQRRGNESPDVFTVRKIAKSILEINCEDDFLPIIVFAISLCVYIGNRAK